MQYTSYYHSPLGDILLAADDIGLTGLWFVGQKYFALYLDQEHVEKETPILKDTKSGWIFIFKDKNQTFSYHFIL